MVIRAASLMRACCDSDKLSYGIDGFGISYMYTCTKHEVMENGISFQNDCPRQPAADCLKQMSGIIEAHRNGLLDPSLTEWLKSLIRAHCTGCRDPECRVPHLAVGW